LHSFKILKLNFSEAKNEIFLSLNTKITTSQFAYYSGFALFSVYLIFCAIYFRERICFADSAHMLVKIINSKGFNIEAGRYPQILTQIPAILAIRLHAPAALVMMIYSISFPLFYGTIALLALKKYHFKWAFPILIFSLVGSVRMGFYHAGTETHQALAWTVLFLAWLMSSTESPSPKGKIIHYLIGAILTVITLHAHPVGLFLLLFSIGVFWIEKRKMSLLEPWLCIVIIGFLGLLKFISTDSDSYEGQFISQIPQFPELIKNIASNWSLDYFMTRISSNYLIISVLFVYGVVWMILSQSFLRLAYFIFANLGFLVFTVLIYHAGDSELMMERAFMPLAFFISVPLCLQWNSNKFLFVRVFQIAVFATVFYFAFANINNKGNYMSSRLTYMDELHTKHKAARIYLPPEEVDMQRVFIAWPYSLETLLYSSSKGNSAQTYSIIVASEADFKRSEFGNPLVFMSNESYGRINFAELNSDYFKIDSTVYAWPAYRENSIEEIKTP
jgi:hypothetical protein